MVFIKLKELSGENLYVISVLLISNLSLSSLLSSLLSISISISILSVLVIPSLSSVFFSFTRYLEGLLFEYGIYFFIESKLLENTSNIPPPS